MSIVGTRVVRTEDPRLLTAGGMYVDDLRAPELAGAAYVTFVRSPLAHAQITGIDVSAALGQPGVVAVFTAAELAPPVPRPDRPVQEPLLAADRVRYAGEPVAIVLTEERYQGEDAAELVSVDYDPLPPVVGTEAAVAGQVLLFPDAGSNVAHTGEAGNCDEASFQGCDVVVERTVLNQRLAPVPLEVRSAAACWWDGRLTAWLSTQSAQIAREAIVRKLGLQPSEVRVITPDVGGGFGAKISADREAVCVAWAAWRTRRPVRWVESRSENLVGMVHGRAQRHVYRIGGTRDGHIRAYHLDITQDCGAYPRYGPAMPGITATMTGGVYDIPHVGATYRSVFTSTTPVSAYRGAGRPEATAAIERAIDDFAAEIGMDPAEVRRRNFVPPEKFPYETPCGVCYDTGDYLTALEKVLAAAGYPELRADQARRRERGDVVQLGIGLASYVEITAADGEDGETARLVVDDTGAATVYTGSSPHGQGHHTAWAMLVQDEMGIPMDRVRVVHGDTDVVPDGVGTFGSRSLQLGGAAVCQAAAEVREKARRLAADMIEASEADLELDTARGAWQVRGDPASGLSWAEVARRVGGEGLSADVRFTTSQATFPFGAHVAVVEVDTETGKVRLVRHVSVDDAGRIINPVLAEGQRHGGIAQGVAQALLEEVRYDADGNPQTATLADYAAITAAELPSFELLSMETPTTVNPLGAKGIGEAGTIGAGPAVCNAVIDAVSHLGIRHIDMPATPQHVWAAISERSGRR
ncbi:MAG TPA: xanthine dehydrogenase family protein molybdopterin-binding subunit [Streptosporangiaceae bacterium]|nr:xanthine dehydrogenase family protein molybdopterin-binding subunit [Streptosporangiaceae bacterium]